MVGTCINPCRAGVSNLRRPSAPPQGTTNSAAMALQERLKSQERCSKNRTTAVGMGLGDIFEAVRTEASRQLEVDGILQAATQNPFCRANFDACRCPDCLRSLLTQSEPVFLHLVVSFASFHPSAFASSGCQYQLIPIARRRLPRPGFLVLDGNDNPGRIMGAGRWRPPLRVHSVLSPRPCYSTNANAQLEFHSSRRNTARAAHGRHVEALEIFHGFRGLDGFTAAYL